MITAQGAAAASAAARPEEPSLEYVEALIRAAASIRNWSVGIPLSAASEAEGERVVRDLRERMKRAGYVGFNVRLQSYWDYGVGRTYEVDINWRGTTGSGSEGVNIG